MKASHRDIAMYAVNQIESGASAGDVAQKIAAVLLSERKTRDMSKVMRSITAELEKRGTSQVTVTSARAVSDDVKQQLAAILGAKNPTFSEVIDESVIGGVKAQSGEKQIDLTVRAKLNRFKSVVAAKGAN